MTFKLNLILIIGSVGTLLFFLHAINKSKMKISNAVSWIIMSLLMIFIAIFPGIADACASMLGIYYTPNMIYLILIALLLFRQFSNVMHVSRLEKQVSALSQEIALRELEKQDSQQDTTKE